jgi:selenocysteine lyase/cysteine desulfurase
MGINIEKVRRNFPHLDEVIYLGAAGAGAFSLVVYDAIIEYWSRRRYASTLGGVDHAWFSEKAVLANREAAKLIGADPDEVCHISRVVQGLNTVKDIIDYSIGWSRGDNVVITDQEYPSSGHTWLSLRKKGVEIHKIRNVNGRILRSEMENAVDDHTKLVCINRTSVGSDATYDIMQVCEIAHPHGALVVDDAIQTVGAKVINVHKDTVDFLLSGSYKWQCGPLEAGLFYAKKEHCEKLESSYFSYINIDRGPGVDGFAKFPFGARDHDPVDSYDLPPPKTAQRFDMGTTATDQIWGWHTALKYLNEFGRNNIEERLMHLGNYISDGLEDIGCTIRTPREEEDGVLNSKRHALTMYTTGSYERDQRSVAEMRNRKQRAIQGPTLKMQGGYGGIRVSPHFYNTEEEIDAMVEWQKKILEKL